MASMIEEVLLTRRMPPWDADPHTGTFSNNASLSVSQAQTLLRWIAQGALRGEDPDPLETYAFPVAAEWPLGEPTLVLRMPKPEAVAASGVLPYRHIEVTATNQSDVWVSAAWVKPGNKKVLHHIIARLKNGGRKDHLGEREMFIGWAPGATQGPWPNGAGKLLPANAKLDFELHYTPNGTDISHKGVTPDVKVEISDEQKLKLANKPMLVATKDDPVYAQAIVLLKTSTAVHPATAKEAIVPTK